MSPIALLLDENLSEAVLGRLLATFPNSSHVRRALGLGAADCLVWQQAKDSGCVLVTRDEDFQRLSLLHGAPPKVIWLSGHNLHNAQVIDTLLRARERIEAFVMDRELALLELR
jgi:predicted nuclease of predicted toxin-antitoxin system